MSEPVVRIDTSKFIPVTRSGGSNESLADAVLTNGYISSLQAYLTREMDAALKEGASLTEGETKMIRGQVWPGWATWRTTKYGETILEGTRFYYRKRQRTTLGHIQKLGDRIDSLKSKEFLSAAESVTLARLSRLHRVMRDTQSPKSVKEQGTGRVTFQTMSAKERRAWTDAPVGQRPWEKVWRARPSGKRHSNSSAMMLDSGRMRQGILSMKGVIVRNGTQSYVEFRPANQVKYFEYQNALRPIWVLNNPKDANYARDLAASVIQDEINRDAARGSIWSRLARWWRGN